MTAGPDHNDEPEQIELPRPKRTLLGRLAHWVEHARALKGWVQEARGRSPALDATFETIERDSHIGGGILAGALSYRLFVFLLPLLCMRLQKRLQSASPVRWLENELAL